MHAHLKSSMFLVEMNSLYFILMICWTPLNYFLNEKIKEEGVSQDGGNSQS